MRFIDEAQITVQAGKGGPGIVSFHRAKYVPKGGPDGGDGGKGGDIIIRASRQLSTLEDTSLKSIYRSENGRSGEGSNKQGKKARDTVITVPVGTLVFDRDNNRLLADLIDHNQECLLARGGKGGCGNKRFATPVNRAPRRAEPGLPGEEKRIRLELKLIADVGLVGRPNAGRSSLLAFLSRANPVIGDFPFSTLTPGLGIVPYGVYQRFVVADIPGIAKGASQGRGLGHQFLRHIQRTRLLIIMIEAPEEDYNEAFEALMNELESYSDDLLLLPRIVVMSKSDLPYDKQKVKEFPFDLKISSITSEGIPQLVENIVKHLEQVEERED